MHGLFDAGRVAAIIPTLPLLLALLLREIIGAVLPRRWPP